ncbi:hypothetical protein BDY17DRAFT_251913 [Neohortaea acidophila]|uniref:Beach-domain-containing protein n=1 Tax=Neohortaea acidophila TaxID=245834 RepID=A0A6A6PU60_9PEZI|nr:uncharacterized protein BDY17DRAFT_251913 [Neohortaea acidophila]KAF2482757.1 hypothetical protein BDY17DRAFT_251913 [Neohortaea acidophila]
MALRVSLARAHASSRGGTRALDATERDSAVATLLQSVDSFVPLEDGKSLIKAASVLEELRKELQGNDSSKDIFRHGHGFEVLLKVLAPGPYLHIGSAASYGQVLRSSLLVLSAAIKDHRGNKKYFKIHNGGWARLQERVTALALLLLDAQGPALLLSSLFQGLLAFALGEDSIDINQARTPENSVPSDPDILHSFSGFEVLSNPEACSVAIRLSLKFTADGCPQELKSTALLFLQIVTAIAELSPRNRVALWNTGILSDILPCLLDARPDSQTENSLGRLFSTLTALGLPKLDDVALLFDRSADSDRSRKLALATLQDSVWPPFIQFDLTPHGYSSIEFPSLPRSFPPNVGYTLTAWMRIDNFDRNCHTTLFGAFDSTQTCFILTYLEKDSQQLILQTSVRSSTPSVRFRSMRFEPDRWYHFALVHRRNDSDSINSTAVLFVDGEFVEQVKCAYPESPQELDPKGGTNSSGAQNARRTHPVQAFFGTPHDLGLRYGPNEVMSRWSLARAHLHAAPLTDEFVAVSHRLSPRYVGNLQDCLGPLLTYRASAELNRYNELLHPDKSEKSDIVTATEKRGSDVAPESRLLLSVYPTAVIGFDDDTTPKNTRGTYQLDRKAAARYHQLAQKAKAVAINASIPNINDAMARSYGTGILTGDPVVAVPKALDDATWRLSGSLPSLVRLLELASTKEAFLQSVQIFYECVVDNWRISESMEKGNGFGILAAIIRQKLGFETLATASSARKATPVLSFEDRQSLPLELLRLILDFMGYDRHNPEESMIVNPMAYRILLVDFDTWRRCGRETQQLYYTQFVHFVSRNKHCTFNQKRLVRMRVVKKLIEAMKSEEFLPDAISPLMEALRALLDNISASPMFRELAMFVAYGLQEDRASAQKTMRSMASVVNVRTKTASLARAIRGSRPSISSGSSTPQLGVSRSELAIHVLGLLEKYLREDRSAIALRRFNKAVPNRWLLHLLAENDVRVVNLTVQILARSLIILGTDFKGPFVEKNGGFITLKARLKGFWRSTTIWLSCLAILFGVALPADHPAEDFTLFSLVNVFVVDDSLHVEHAEILPVIMAMLEAGLRDVVKQNAADEDFAILKTVTQFLSELYSRSANFREFAVSSRYIQEILFVLYPVLVGSDRLSAETELQSEKDELSFKGEAVKMRGHSNSVGERPPSVRSLDMNGNGRTPSPSAPIRIQVPRKMSAFVLINPIRETPAAPLRPAVVPTRAEPVAMNPGNSIVESLLEVVVSIFLDLICNKEKFNGIGLFQKVPPGFREHQAYFQSYVMVHTLTQLWNHLQLNQSLLLETRVLTNLTRFCQHMSEAVFEGWFIDGAQPFLDFSGKLLEYLQQSEVAMVKNVRLCSQNINSIRIAFLRVCLSRLSELDESINETEATTFLNKMSYWQTILFSSDNQETLFIRLICFLLYMKLVSDAQTVRLAAASLWRTVLMQKPTESATLLTYVAGSEHRHLSTGFMNMCSTDDDEFLPWVDENRQALDTVFMDALKKPWADFVADENRRTEESARSRLEKRKDKLRQWQMEESQADEFMHRYEISTNHWRSNVHSQERLKLQRALQDHQESVNHLLTVFSTLEQQVTQPCGIQPDKTNGKWQLDETEAVNRMRMRTIRDTSEHQAFQPKQKAMERRLTVNLAINTDIGKAMADNIMSPAPVTPLVNGEGGSGRPRSESQQLLEGEFEIVDDPREADDGIIEDKNRKVMTSLERGDMVQQLHNISRIVGLEACEGLLVVGKKCLYLQDNFFQRSDGEIVSVSQAPEDERDPYLQWMTGKDIGSRGTKHSLGDHQTRHWTWTEVLSISKRRFLFRDVSMEIFFTDGRSYLLTCMSSKVRDDLYNAIAVRAPQVHTSITVASEDSWRLDTLRNPEEIPQSLGSKFVNVFNNLPTHTATKKWVKGEMSNFQYLMLVNTLAGRTFNDLTQYPVFPWVLADYSSEELDLNDPKSFRDLSKPMGCQTRGRATEYKTRYKEFEGGPDPPFHYGTHYSSAMIVASYLIRLQPFVQSYLLLQGGTFDHADRLFDSIEKAWLSASRDTMGDVRELIPEFFYLPEFLVNVNGYDFGMKQAGDEAVNHVKLPPWAKGDPFVFVSKHREALESPYVSEHLHKWIDLVFGFKQRGEAAVEATNVFSHLTYQGAKDLDTIDDPVERLASITAIHSFGQTPHQVFLKSHPSRELEKSAPARLDALVESLARLPDPVLHSDEQISSLAFSPTQERLLHSGPHKIHLLPHGERYMEIGFADNSIRFFSAHTRRLLGLYENTHIGPITATTLVDSKILATGGADCTIGIWNIHASRDHIDLQPKQYLFGHRTPITILTASRMFSTLLSASADGHVLLWGLNRYHCIRVLHPAGQPAIRAASISNASGHILLCEDSHLLLYTLNGHLLTRQKVCESEDERLLCCAFYEGAGNEWVSRELIVTGHAGGVANVWALTTLIDGSWYLQLVRRLSHAAEGRGDEDEGGFVAGITAVLPRPNAIYTGDEEGRVWEWDCVAKERSGGSGWR